MKKGLLVLILAAILTTGTAFANDPRPDGFGIGVVAGGVGVWESGAGFGWNYGLALHLADIYWGINLRVQSNWVYIGATGDFLTLLGGNITGPLGWYIDAGLYGAIGLWNPDEGDGGVSFDIGARLPIGLNLNFQVVDIWLAFVPRLGVGIRTFGDDTLFLGGGWGPEFGFRIWL